jgi:hypothetical protein
LTSRNDRYYGINANRKKIEESTIGVPTAKKLSNRQSQPQENRRIDKVNRRKIEQSTKPTARKFKNRQSNRKKIEESTTGTTIAKKLNNRQRQPQKNRRIDNRESNRKKIEQSTRVAIKPITGGII